MSRLLAGFGLIVAVACQPLWVGAAPAPTAKPLLGLIIDDIGDNAMLGRRAVNLPGPVALAFLPRTPHARELSETAQRRGKEVLLHLPLESIDDRPLGPGGLTLHMTREQFEMELASDLEAIPHAVGVNNHMGSLLTRHPGHMKWLMDALFAHGNLFFVDSRTTVHTVAEKVALEAGVPAISRDVFIDHDLDTRAVDQQLRRWVAQARREGHAVAIGHPNPVTLRALERLLPKLGDMGFELVPIRTLIERKNRLLWQASTSAPAAAGNTQ